MGAKSSKSKKGGEAHDFGKEESLSLEKHGAGKCPFLHHQRQDKKIAPAKLDLKVLRQADYFSQDDYAKHFAQLDLAALKADLAEVLTTPQDWWPADWGNYGPLMIRLAWHSAGTYRVHDGRGGANTGNMRFAPLNSWPDNGNLDKARRLLYPLKKKYGKQISWGDLMILAGNVALETMGFKTFGFAGGRVDVWEPEADVYWGPETVVLANERYGSNDDRTSLEEPLGAVVMGLIYVNPEGPEGNPDPALSAQDIRVTFGRMAMNDEETVALIAGGHTFGKAHGAGRKSGGLPAPNANVLEAQGFGFFQFEQGDGVTTSGLEGAWTKEPTKWDNGYFHNLFTYEWKLTKSPGGAHQWTPKNYGDKDVPEALDPDTMTLPIMLTSDIALKADPEYEKISRRFWENPEEFADAFARAWYKLTHRDMGPVTRLLGPEVAPAQLWQDPVSEPEGPTVSDAEIAELKTKIDDSSLSVTDLVSAAWASASSFRKSDFRGGANGARLFLEPQRSWEINKGFDFAAVEEGLKKVQADFNGSHDSKISLADLVVVAGMHAVEKASGAKCDFTPGRTDATQEQTDLVSFGYLEPRVDGFVNFGSASAHALVDKAHLLTLSAPEMTVLVAGLRSLGVSHGDLGVFTKDTSTLSNDFCEVLTDMDLAWSKTDTRRVFQGNHRTSGETQFTASSVDLLFGSNPELRAIIEYYGQEDCAEQFKQDFANAFSKVMNLDQTNYKMS